MADDYMQAAVGPIDPQQGQRDVLPTKGAPAGLLQQLLPLLSVVVPAIGAAATTSKWSGPGAAVARGAMGGLAGAVATQPSKYTEEDRYHAALADRVEIENHNSKRALSNVDAWIKTLPPEERTQAAMDPPGYIKLQRDARLREPLIQNLTKVYGLHPETLHALSNTQLQRMAGTLATDRQRNRDAKPDRVIRKALFNPTTGQPLQLGEDPKTGVEGDGVFDQDTGRFISVVTLKAPTAPKSPKAPEVVGEVLDKARKEGVEKLTPAEKAIYEKATAVPPKKEDTSSTSEVVGAVLEKARKEGVAALNPAEKAIFDKAVFRGVEASYAADLARIAPPVVVPTPGTTAAPTKKQTAAPTGFEYVE